MDTQNVGGAKRVLPGGRVSPEWVHLLDLILSAFSLSSDCSSVSLAASGILPGREKLLARVLAGLTACNEWTCHAGRSEGVLLRNIYNIHCCFNGDSRSEGKAGKLWLCIQAYTEKRMLTGPKILDIIKCAKTHKTVRIKRHNGYYINVKM